MPRPKQCRCVTGSPAADYFKPRGIPLTDLEECRLSLEEFEVLRLADLEGKTALEASALMKISRYTFGRILAGARHKVADAIVNGKALAVEKKEGEQS